MMFFRLSSNLANLLFAPSINPSSFASEPFIAAHLPADINIDPRYQSTFHTD